MSQPARPPLDLRALRVKMAEQGINNYRELAELAELTPSYVRALARGYPSGKEAQAKIARALKCQIADIWPETPTQGASP